MMIGPKHLMMYECPLLCYAMMYEGLLGYAMMYEGQLLRSGGGTFVVGCVEE